MRPERHPPFPVRPPLLTVGHEPYGFGVVFGALPLVVAAVSLGVTSVDSAVPDSALEDSWPFFSSALKALRDCPIERARAGRRVAPNSSTTTRRMMIGVHPRNKSSKRPMSLSLLSLGTIARRCAAVSYF